MIQIYQLDLDSKLKILVETNKNKLAKNNNNKMKIQPFFLF